MNPVHQSKKIFFKNFYRNQTQIENNIFFTNNIYRKNNTRKIKDDKRDYKDNKIDNKDNKDKSANINSNMNIKKFLKTEESNNNNLKSVISKEKEIEKEIEKEKKEIKEKKEKKEKKEINEVNENISNVNNNKSKETKKRKAKSITNDDFKLNFNKYDSPILLIDSSYASFYRFYALQIWFGLAHKEKMEEIKLLDEYNWSENEIFMEKYEKMYLSPFDKIRKKYNIPFSNMIFAMDCPRDKIWRMKLFDKYKSNRDTERHRKCHVKDVLKYTYNTIFPKLIETQNISTIKIEEAEADDIIAIIKKKIREVQPEREIVIVTGDFDYLQLADKSTKIIDLKGKLITDKSIGDPKLDLLSKVISGDNSDYIPAIINKCGPKTTTKFIENQDTLRDKLNKDEKARNNFFKNRLLIDFDMIPEYIKTKIIKKFYEMDFILENFKSSNKVCNHDFFDFFDNLRIESKYEDLYSNILAEKIENI